jgi:glycosyltransferase involved in cell wall biosynthesis
MDAKPTLHLIGIFHTIHNQEYSHCAFTGKALRFSKMMRAYGYNVIEYANEGSESEANEKVVMLRSDEFQTMLGRTSKTAFHGDHASTGTKHHSKFEERLIPELKKRVQPRDIICHPFGHSHASACNEFQKHLHCETGIGYPTTMPGTMKIFESYAWRHFHCGKDNRQGTNYEWVIPNYFEIDDWDPQYEPGKYIAFMGRITESKGLPTISELAKYVDKKIILCGQGDHKTYMRPNIEYWGPLEGRQRSMFIGNAICSLMPTTFIEPFGGSGVEGMLCGTPLIASDYGAFTETVLEGVTGYRCKTLWDWIEAIERVGELDRKVIADRARATYSLQACGKKYDKAFTQMSQLHDDGWYTLPPKYRKEQLQKSA